MNYTDEEMLAWWKGLPAQDQCEIFERIENSKSAQFFLKEMVASICRRWVQTKNITPKQIAVLRKWAR